MSRMAGRDLSGVENFNRTKLIGKIRRSRDSRAPSEFPRVRGGRAKSRGAKSACTYAYRDTVLTGRIT